ncbi:MAG TPA: EAL domain-containing protein, partial [Bauldia sp.]|nr:EAL domain-containing protein [Bauldia sp.]
PVAEQSGMIGELTYALLRTACLDAQQWPEGYGLSLNISPVQLRDQNMPSMIGEILAAFGFPPALLEVEVTENAIVEDLEAARSVIAALRSLGVRIALDDFGTGYAGLYHLRQLTFDKIKIDRSFISSMATEPESTRIVNAILALTRSLGLPTTAEGIETSELVSSMVGRGCQFGQGYYFSKAVPASEVPAICARWQQVEAAVLTNPDPSPPLSPD